MTNPCPWCQERSDNLIDAPRRKELIVVICPRCLGASRLEEEALVQISNDELKITDPDLFTSVEALRSILAGPP